MSVKVEPFANYVLRNSVGAVIDADLICEDLWTDNNQYERDCNLYWSIPSMRPLEIFVYNISMTFNSINGQAIKPVSVSNDEGIKISYDRETVKLSEN